MLGVLVIVLGLNGFTPRGGFAGKRGEVLPSGLCISVSGPARRLGMLRARAEVLLTGSLAQEAHPWFESRDVGAAYE